MTHWGAATASDRQATTLQKLQNIDPVELKVDIGPLAGEAPGKLSEGIRALYQKCQFYDVVLVAAGMRFPAHQAVLGAMSPRLCEQLRQAARPGDTAGAEASVEGVVPATGSSPQAGPVPEPRELPRGSPELHLQGISSPEAVRALLDFAYGLGSGYDVASDAANRDVIRLAKQFELADLEDLAIRRLAGDLNSANVIDRLATCEEFGLHAMFELVVDQMALQPSALVAVAGGQQVLQHPKILQQLLLRAATVHGGAKVRPVGEETSGRPAKYRKVEVNPAGVGGA